MERQVTVQATSSHFAAFLLEPTTGAFFRYLRQLALGVAGDGDPAGRAFDAQETICCWLRPT